MGRKSVSPEINAVINSHNNTYDKSLSPYACKNADALRRRQDSEDIRQPFFHDGDRIVHSRAYARYIDKTQVFYLVKNDHITHRVLHVQLVSKIARLIGRSLRLNEDLIEAIALGHDIGHAPYGHDGEKYLSAVCCKYGIGGFHHNVQSVWALDRIESLNLSLQVQDGILAHNGEAHDFIIEPEPDKGWDNLEREMTEQLFRKDGHSGIRPMTLEGCVVRVADTISYLGRDIDDAITLKLIERGDIPQDCAEVLGDNNRDIVNNLVVDVIENSYGLPRIALSREMADVMRKLKDFNYNHIYTHPKIKDQAKLVERMFGMLFDTFVDDLNVQRRSSKIYMNYIDGFAPERWERYSKGLQDAQIVRDFIGGMTDEYFNDTFRELYLPQKKSMY